MAAAILQLIAGAALIVIWLAFLCAAIAGDRGAALFCVIAFFPMVIPGLDFIAEALGQIYIKRN